MTQLFHKAKHWQLFIGLILPIVFMIPMQLSMFANIGHPDRAVSSALNMFTLFPLMMLPPIIVLFGWNWSIGIGLQRFLPEGMRMRTGFLKLAIIYPMAYIGLFLLGITSVFTLNLPIEEGEPETESTVEHASLTKLPILVVEDNVVNQKVIVKMLEKMDFTTMVANNGQEALKLLDEHEFCLVLMDLQMPVMDGFTCTKHIRCRPGSEKNLPIIAVTANIMDADKSRCIECGMNDFIAKPVKFALLEERITAHLNPSMSPFFNIG